MPGIVGYGAYIPYYRLERRRIAGVLGSGGGQGTRAVAAYDEDTTSMAVEAGRVALSAGLPGEQIRQLFFATATPAYADKTNATAIHAALRLPASALAVDVAGAVRSGAGALIAAAQSPVPAMAVLSDIRTGLPGGADERDGGDGAAAFVFGPGTPSAPVLAEVICHASATAEFLDRWRTPGAPASRVWEERFGEEAYAPLAEAAITDALKQASLTPDQVDHLIVAGLHGRAVRRVIAASGISGVADSLAASIGNAGTAQAGILLANVLDQATPGQHVVLVILADGATAIVARTTAALAKGRPSSTVAEQIAAGNAGLEYAAFLSWRGFLDREPPRRPDPEPVAAPPAARRADWKFALVASECERCGTRALPPDRVCRQCHAVDEMTAVPLADTAATVATYTIDRLAYTPSPPVLTVVLDFDGGGRLRCQLTDAATDEVRIGLRAGMTFRRVVTASGVHNYFWKARPIREQGR